MINPGDFFHSTIDGYGKAINDLKGTTAEYHTFQLLLM